jgi:nucleoside-diphosphate-sugar epimerase
MTISILGCGWLGLPMGHALAQAGHTVRGSTTSPDKLPALVSAGLAPYLVRLPVTPGDPVHEQPLGFWDADALVVAVPPPRGVEDRTGSSRVQMEALAQRVAQHGVGWVVHCSSTGVYPALGREVGEDDAGPQHGPLRAGGEAVWAAEETLRDADLFDTTVLRLAGLYGPGRPPGRFLAGKTDLPGASDPVNLVHRDDVIEAGLRLIERAPGDPTLRRETLNLCADEHPTRSAFYPDAARRLGLQPPTFAPAAAPVGNTVRNERAKARLGLRFRPLGQG